MWESGTDRRYTPGRCCAVVCKKNVRMVLGGGTADWMNCTLAKVRKLRTLADRLCCGGGRLILPLTTEVVT